MKSFSRLFAGLALCAAVLSCEENTSITGIVRDGIEKDIIVKRLDVNRFQVLDTLKTNEEGAFSYALDLEEAQPEFIYLFYGDRQVASLLLKAGDIVVVETDTLGAYSVKGSEESLNLQKVENAYNACVRDMSRILANPLQGDAALSRRYVAYYRDRVSYVMSHPYSLTVVPVFFQQLNDGLPVFSQPADGFLMRNIADSLATRYPDSPYVKALEKEAERRINTMELNAKIGQAQEVGYFDMELPGIDGKKTKLSEHISKVTMVYFWATTAEQKMFNLDALKPIYEEFHPKGFEIYAVALNEDKAPWGAAVRNQNLPWINVCDIRGAESPYVGTYAVTSLPLAWFIVDGVIDPDAKVRDAADIRGYLRKKL
ncbi:MAG: TlpA family protein disulfide reductase [Bacteroidales bacterium]|nr:TlpA family protein disulfide reductase [Bacteroidales bacterium]